MNVLHQKVTKKSSITSTLWMVVLLFVGSLFANKADACYVDKYTSCGYVCVGGTLTVSANIYTNAGSRIRWQYRINNGSWVCLNNGTNSINGNSYSISGAVTTGGDGVYSLVISNAQLGLDEVEFRPLMNESNYDPCSPNGTTVYNGESDPNNTSKIMRVHVLSGSDCNTISTYCGLGGCTNNLLFNSTNGYFGGFESKSITPASTDYSSSGGCAGQVNAVANAKDALGSAAQFGPHSGNYMLYVDGSTTGSNRVWYYNVNVTAGTTYQYSAWVANAAHVNSALAQVSLRVNGTQIANATVTAVGGQWIFVSGSYTAMTSGSVTLQIYDNNTACTYNDFVVDDICWKVTNVTYSLGDFVWLDRNGNGLQDSGEPGIYNATVKLYADADNNNLPDGPALQTRTTAANGGYAFTTLNAGRYIVSVTRPAGYVAAATTSTSSDPNNFTGNDNNAVTTSGNEVMTRSINLTANNTTVDLALAADCSCVNSSGNVLINGSFENGSTGWSVVNGTITTGGGYVMCGANNGFLNWSSGTASIFQDVNIAAGSVVNFSGFAGTHTPGISCSPRLRLLFLNSSNTILAQSSVTITKDVDKFGAALDLYTLSGTAPTGTTKVRIQGDVNCDYLKLDGFCMTVVPPCATSTAAGPDQSKCNSNSFTMSATAAPASTTGTWSVVSGAASIASVNSPTSSVTVTSSPAKLRWTVSRSGCTDVFAEVNLTSTTVTTANAGPNQTRNNTSATMAANAPATGETGIWSVVSQPAGSPLVTYSNVNSPTTTINNMNTSGNYTFRWTITRGTCTSTSDVTITINTPCIRGSETWPNSWGGNFTTNLTNSTTTQATGTWTINTNANAAFAITPPYYSPSTSNALKIVNWRTDGVSPGISPAGAGYATAVSPTTDISNPCCPTGHVMQMTLWTYNVVSGDNNAWMGIDFSNDNGATWTTVFQKTSGQIFIDYGANTVTTITIPVNPIFNVNTFRYRFRGESRINNPNNFYMFVDDILFISPSVCNVLTLGNNVWFDINNNGVKEAGEPGIPNVTVDLLNSTGGVIQTTFTDASGNYQFNNLTAGTYSVGAIIPSGYARGNNGVTNINADDQNDAVSTINGEARTGQFSLTASSNNIDIGLSGPLTLGNTVWADANNNGIQDAGEAGIPNVTVRLYNSAGTLLQTTTTNSTGNYQFTGLIAGTYSAGALIPAGYSRSDAGATDINTDNQNDATSTVSGEARTGTFSLTTSSNNIDFGLKGVMRLGDLVWNDLNVNGLREAGEPGLANVTLNLFRDSDQNNIPDGSSIATTTTNASGIYTFNNLVPGSYIVSVVFPARYSSSGITLSSFTPNNDVDNDNNGINPIAGGFRSNFITLTLGGEPTTFAADGNSNFSMDFALIPDNDGDGHCDCIDIDDDNDGITDVNESGGYDPLADCDGDGIKNYLDQTPGCPTPSGNDPWGQPYKPLTWTDCNNDGINDFFDWDRDGIINEMDLDSDNDGILDVREARPDSKDFAVSESLAVNGNFDAGNTGFSSDYATPGSYSVTNNPNSVWSWAPNCTGFGGSGNMLIGDGNGNANARVWYQTITVKAGIPYTLSFYAFDFWGGAPAAKLQWGVNGTKLGPVSDLSIGGCNTWKQITATYIPSTSGAVVIAIYNNETSGASNDFGIDNISITSATVVNGMITGNDPDKNGLLSSAENGNPNPVLNGIQAQDLDRDGTPNFLDLDSDGDGMTDIRESFLTDLNNDVALISATNLGTTTGNDIDYDGVRNELFTGAAGTAITADKFPGTGADGITPIDSDGDGYPNPFDIDSDNDGITDHVEGQPTCSYVLPCTTDADGDGLQDCIETTTVGNCTRRVGAGVTPADKDSDGIPDYLDLDTDNDGVPDRNEGSGINGNYVTQTGDSDRDGMFDQWDTFNILNVTEKFTNNVGHNQMGPNGNYDGPVPSGSTAQLPQRAVGSCPSVDRDWRNVALLPVALIRFDGVQTGNLIKLTWKTAQEISMKQYEVERSINGRDFVKIAIVQSANAAAEREYSSNDEVSNLETSKVYYRLRMVNGDNSFTYSNVVAFKLTDNKASLTIRPNPARTMATVTVKAAKAQVSPLTIMTMDGKIVKLTAVTLNKGVNNIDINNLGNFATGSYIIQLFTEENLLTGKMIIER